MQQFYTVPLPVHEYVHTSVARVASKDIGHYATQCIVTLTHVGRLSVIHVPHAVIQTKHGRSTLGLLTAGTLCRARLGYASSFRSECATRRVSFLAPVSSSLRTPCRSSPQMPASGRSRLRQSTEGTRPHLMRKTPAPLHGASCSQRTSILECPVQIAWPCSLRHCHCSTIRYFPLLLWSS